MIESSITHDNMGELFSGSLGKPKWVKVDSYGEILSVYLAIGVEVSVTTGIAKDAVKKWAIKNLIEPVLRSEDIYPLTIVRDRYNGCYTGGRYLAFNLDPWQIPRSVDGDDGDCQDFALKWSESEPVRCGEFGYGMVYGRGEQVGWALTDLKDRLQRFIKRGWK